RGNWPSPGGRSAKGELVAPVRLWGQFSCPAIGLLDLCARRCLFCSRPSTALHGLVHLACGRVLFRQSGVGVRRRRLSPGAGLLSDAWFRDWLRQATGTIVGCVVILLCLAGQSTVAVERESPRRAELGRKLGLAAVPGS